MSTSRLICIVDDDDDYRNLLQRVFSHFFSAYPVRFFSSGRDFLRDIRSMSERPALILLDRHMPDLDGHQTLVLLKQNADYKRIPVVMISNDPSPLEIEGCYEAGANSFLLKTDIHESLKETLSLICQYWLEINQRSN